MEVLQLCLIFENFILKLKHLRKHLTKMLIPQNLLTNVWQNLVIIYLFKNLFSAPFQNWNSVTIFRESFQYHQKETERCISKRLKFYKLKIFFQTGSILKIYFRFKDRVSETLQTNFVNEFKCGSCYYGKTYKNMKVWVSEHQSVCPRTGRQVKGTLSTSVRDHMLNFDHAVGWEDISIIGTVSSHYLLEIKESLLFNERAPR